MDPAEPESTDRPCFFLSYARTPAWGSEVGRADHWVRVLFTDLCDHVTALTDLPLGARAGFMDREDGAGDGWSDRAGQSLATCSVFVALFSPRYFSSELCGREWFAFNERVLRARAVGSGAPPAVVPVLWTPVDPAQLPDSVKHVPIGAEPGGDRYATQGIYGLIKLSRLREEYDEAVLRLAQRIVRAAREAPPPPERPRRYEDTPSAFKPRGTEPRRIHLTVAAPTLRTLPEHRDTRPYGEDAQDWNPYHEESARPLPALAEELIRSLDYQTSVSSLDAEDTDESPGGDGAGQATPSRPGILLVDRWALTDEARRRRLRTFDDEARPWVGAIVPWDPADPQGHGEEGRRLAADLEQTLPLILDRGRRAGCRTAVDGVPTLRAFTDALPAVVAHATRQYLKHAEAHPPVGPSIRRPRLLGPAHPSRPAGGSDHGGDET
ncbi:TIR-like protein FxsC [Streptomyces sp. SAS_267]|uniref:TIR-like protein FxsC n=1 Tax=unclassified Streptomyces TaxID=2593676 RepID=UPI0036FADF39